MKQYLELYCPQLETFLGDRSFIVGDELTYVDFLAYEMFDQHRFVSGSIVKMSIPSNLTEEKYFENLIFKALQK